MQHPQRMPLWAILSTIMTATMTTAAMMTVTTPVAAAIYHCQQQGRAVFSDTPCGGDARVVEVDPVRTGGRLDQGSDAQFYQPPARRQPGTSGGCPAGYIQSSDLRRMRVEKRVQEGLSEDQVRYILGDPERRDGQWWVYQRRGQETGRYRFRRGCLSTWR